VRQDAVTRDRRYGPLMAKRSEGRKEVCANYFDINFSIDYQRSSTKNIITTATGNLTRKAINDNIVKSKK